MVSTIDQSASRTKHASGCLATMLVCALCAGALVSAARAASTPVYLVLTVFGPQGKPVPQFEAMLHSHQHGYVPWQKGAKGKIDFWSDGVQTLRTKDDPHVQVIVRAPNLAPAVLHLENKASRMHETVRITPGRLVEASIRTADDKPIPKSLTPLVVYPDLAGRVRMMRQPQNARPGRVVDFVMSKVHRTAEGRYQFRVPSEPAPFFLAIHEPGFMLSLESDIITEDELADNRIEWRLPAPAKLHLRFDLANAKEVPACRAVLASVASYIPDTGKYYTVWRQEFQVGSFDAWIDDLTPGRQMVRLMFMPPETEDIQSSGPAPRLFRETAMLDLTAGQTKTLAIDYVPFDPDAWRGDATATFTLNHYAGRPAAGEAFTVSYIDPHYRGPTVLEGRLDAEGRFQLQGVRPGPDGPEFFLRIDDRWSRRIKIVEPDTQQFEFTLAPQLGDRVPDVPLLDLATNRSLSLASLRASIIYLEFWATWCGPCKKPMAKLNGVAKKRRQQWGDRVHILAASIDDTSEIVERYAQQRGWTHVRHLWAGDGSDRAFYSKVAQAFGVNGVPTALLIDPDGRIVWRGHPNSADCEAQIDQWLKQTEAPPKED